MTSSNELRILQFCYGYEGPYLDSARQYASLFRGTPYKVTTVFLTGRSSPSVAAECKCDEVLFMEFSAQSVRGFKLRAIREFRHIAATRDFKLCITHRTKPAYIASMATDLPIISVHHTYGDFRRLSRKMYSSAFKNRLHLLAVSDSIKEDILSCLPGWPEDRIHRLYNRIDVPSVRAALHTRDEARERLGLSADSWVIGHVGRLHPDKNQAALIRGFAAAKPNLPADTQLVICGKGRLEHELRSLAIQLGVSDQVLFTGQIHDAKRLFKAFDVFVLSSDREPFGMVLLEAMAAEVPLICSDAGGCPEVVGDAGKLFTAKDALSLAARLVEVAEMSEEDKIAAASRMRSRVVEKFSDDAARGAFWSLPALMVVQQG